jgi:hypothetical protein
MRINIVKTGSSSIDFFHEDLEGANSWEGIQRTSGSGKGKYSDLKNWDFNQRVSCQSEVLEKNTERAHFDLHPVGFWALKNATKMADSHAPWAAHFYYHSLLIKN